MEVDGLTEAARRQLMLRSNTVVMSRALRRQRQVGEVNEALKESESVRVNVRLSCDGQAADPPLTVKLLIRLQTTLEQDWFRCFIMMLVCAKINSPQTLNCVCVCVCVPVSRKVTVKL